MTKNNIQTLIKKTIKDADEQYLPTLKCSDFNWKLSKKGKTGSNRVLCRNTETDPESLIIIGTITATYYDDDLGSNFVLRPRSSESLTKVLEILTKSLDGYTASPTRHPNPEALKIKIKSIEDIDFAKHLEKNDLKDVKSKNDPISIVKNVLLEDALVAINVNLRSYDIKDGNSGFFFDCFDVFVLDQEVRATEDNPRKKIKFNH